MSRYSNTPQNKTLLSIIGSGIATFFTLSVLCGVVVFTLMIVVNSSNDPITEKSPIEYIEQLLLSLNIAFFLIIAVSQPVHRRFALLTASFFTCLLIRELDAFFDQIIHGFWKYPAILLASIAIFYASRSLTETLQGLACFVQSSYFNIVVVGMAMLLVFSRLFGMAVLWEMLMDENYQRAVKNLVEEGTELMAYTIITYGNFLIYREIQASTDSSQDLEQQRIDINKLSDDI